MADPLHKWNLVRGDRLRSLDKRDNGREVIVRHVMPEDKVMVQNIDTGRVTYLRCPVRRWELVEQ